MSNKNKQLTAIGWAWKIQDMDGNWHLCRWSETTRAQLILHRKPSPEAVAVRVKMTINE
jgi:hypothetical protein